MVPPSRRPPPLALLLRTVAQTAVRSHRRRATTPVLLFSHSRVGYLSTALASIAATHPPTPPRGASLPFLIRRAGGGRPGHVRQRDGGAANLRSHGGGVQHHFYVHPLGAHVPVPTRPEHVRLLVPPRGGVPQDHSPLWLRPPPAVHRTPSSGSSSYLVDDMRLSPKAFTYWVATAPLLDANPTLSPVCTKCRQFSRCGGCRALQREQHTPQ